MDAAVWVAIISFVVGPMIGYLIRRRELIDARDVNTQLRSELARAKALSLPSMLGAEAYGIRIETPVEYADVDQSFAVSGTFGNLPEGQEIWTSTFQVYKGENGRPKKRYWPQARAKTSITSEGKKWSSQVHNIGGHTKGEAKEFLVLVVGVDGQSLFGYFKKAGGENNSWPGIDQLTTDIVECTVGKVHYSPK